MYIISYTGVHPFIYEAHIIYSQYTLNGISTLRNNERDLEFAKRKLGMRVIKSVND